ncbi:serine/threonine protein kinase [Streptomyces sp. PSKA54]|uniref:non-specific serine/threonine protein kinase n=1 Tax=Streptomyces himalayensis subsp. aureolus TaxID=2758039 RepID=A0A7W2HH91_9ACTN|nr:serine/threonine-protein kinase [Streptomyces himalayensis]MBA4863716.1 serine/threonine protein kinase [Streptomyces himalayensis subsp. aureolus]
MSDEGRLVAGRYRLAERVGRGGMGTVWRAEDELLGRQVAVKRLHVQPHLADDELTTLYERTRREARSAARIAHPNVVVVHDVVEDDGLPCIVMEYVPSTTLGALLTGGRTIPSTEAARTGRGMIAALRAAHAAGVLHRDVKPGNVLLGSDGRIVLTDFGIAMATGTSTLTKPGEVIGSIDYIAPERIRGRTPGPASDLWALGATLYQAVEGRPPFRRDTAVETAYAIAVDPVQPMKHAGPLEPLIKALLAKDPEERPSAEEVERVLRAPESQAVTVPIPARTPAAHRSASDQEAAHLTWDGVTVNETASVRDARLEHAAPDSAPDTASDENPALPEPAGSSGVRKRDRRSRAPLWSAVAVVVVAAAVAGGLYGSSLNSSADTHDSSGNSGATTAVTTTPAGTPTSYAPSPVPPGYHLVEEKGLGVAFPIPDGWTAGKRTGEQVTYIDGSGLVGITIGVVDPAGSDPLEHFKDIEANTKVNYSVYKRLYLQHATFRGQPAAVWAFTFQGQVRVFRAIDFGFVQDGREYDIYLSAPEKTWDTHQPVFDKVKDGFRLT